MIANSKQVLLRWVPFIFRPTIPACIGPVMLAQLVDHFVSHSLRYNRGCRDTQVFAIGFWNAFKRNILDAIEKARTINNDFGRYGLQNEILNGTFESKFAHFSKRICIDFVEGDDPDTHNCFSANVCAQLDSLLCGQFF